MKLKFGRRCELRSYRERKNARLRASSQPDPANEVRKSRVAPQGIKIGMHFDDEQNVRLLLIGLLEPAEGLVIFIEP
jgi:hypothetical protein